MTAHAKPLDRRVLDLKDPSLLVGQAYVAGEWIDAPDRKTIPVGYVANVDSGQKDERYAPRVYAASR